MTKQRIVTEIGLGTDIRGRDYTKAACRALRDALWHNSLGIADIIDIDVDSMWVEVIIGVPNPNSVKTQEVLELLPHGKGNVSCIAGGLEIKKHGGEDATIMANAVAIVYLDIPEGFSI
ncbi:MAG: hypothetical protein CMM58_14430 [Rhodospirillaceae bacterium]|nr:hypothetical protein [Rhodospirillaceae bacterium]|tara:strand:+ start:1212 stop:1568 length:357 start_codon:yes stop_codon:yes gene_type:complete